MNILRGISHSQKIFKLNRPGLKRFFSPSNNIRSFNPFVVLAGAFICSTATYFFWNKKIDLLDDANKNDPSSVIYDPELKVFGMDPNVYHATLQKHLEETGKNSDPKYRQIKTAQLVEDVTNAWLNTEKTKFDLDVIEALKEIGALKPGRKLLKELYLLNPSLKIKLDPEKPSEYILNENVLLLGSKHDVYKYVLGQDKIELIKDINFNTRLAQQLIYALHYSKSREEFDKNYNQTKNLLNTTFGNLEAQRTICGIVNLRGPVDSLCENAFRKAWNQPLRVNQSGLSTKIDEPLTIKDWIQAYSIILKTDPRKNKITLNFDAKFEESIKNYTEPHTFLINALETGGERLVKMLINAGAIVTPDIVKADPRVLKFTPHLLSDENIILARLFKEPESFSDLSPEMQNSREFVLKGVKIQPRILLQTSDKMLDDDEVVRTAFNSGCPAEVFAKVSLRLRNDLDFVETLKFDNFLEHAGEKVVGNRQFMFRKVSERGAQLEFATPALQDDKDLVLEAVRTSRSSLKYASLRLRDDFDVVWEAIRDGAPTLHDAGPSMRDNEMIALRALANNYHDYNALSERLKKDPKIIEAKNKYSPKPRSRYGIFS